MHFFIINEESDLMLDSHDIARLDKVSPQALTRYAQLYYREGLPKLYRRFYRKLGRPLEQRLRIGNDDSIEEIVTLIWSPLMLCYERDQAIPWIFLLSRETAMFLRQNEQR